jgi:hypothetical protein
MNRNSPAPERQKGLFAILNIVFVILMSRVRSRTACEHSQQTG